MAIGTTILRTADVTDDTRYSDSLHFVFLAFRKLCPKLEAPDNGAVKQSGVYPGDGAYYKCGKGFELVGDEHRTCQKDGTFSGSAPICQRNLCYLSLTLHPIIVQPSIAAAFPHPRTET